MIELNESNNDTTLGKIEIMQAYLDGEDIRVRVKNGTCRDIIRNVKVLGITHNMEWNWRKYEYTIIRKYNPVRIEKYTNVLGDNIYNVYSTEKEAIFHSNARFDRAGVKVLITEVV